MSVPGRRLLLVLLLAATAPAWTADVATQYRESLASLAATDPEAHFKLGVWCADNRLTAEAEALFRKVIELAPEHLGARQRLGHQKVNGRWLTADEAYQAKGYRKYLGQWLPPSRHDAILKRQERMRALAKARSDWANAWEFKSRYFQIRTNTSAQVAEEMAIAMDLCFDRLRQVFGLEKTPRPVPLEIYATRAQFIEGSAKAGMPIGGGTLGYYWYGSAGRGIRCFYAGSVDRTLSTLFHECTHLVVNEAIGSPVPTWSNEGPAVMFEDARREEDGIDIQAIPWGRLWQLQSRLKAGGAVSLNELVQRQGGAQYPAECYPQGWSLMHFLCFADNGRNYKRVGEYFRVMSRSRGTADNLGFFKAAFGSAPDGFQAAWKAYVLGLAPKTAQDHVDAAEASCSFWFDLAQAERHARTAAELEPQGWRGHLALGRVRLVQAMLASGDKADDLSRQALEEISTAVERSGWKTIVKKKGKSILHQIGMHLDLATAAIGAGDHERAADVLEGVLAVDDLNAPAYRTLALLHGTARDPGFRNGEEARRLLALADDLGADHANRYVEAMILAAEGKKAEAAAILTKAAGDDPFGIGGRIYPQVAARLNPAPAKPATKAPAKGGTTAP